MPDRTLVVVGAGAVLALAALGWFAQRRLVESLTAMPPGSFNPGSTNNVVYRGVNEVVQAATGDSGATLGTWLFETLNPGTVAREREGMNGTPATEPALIYTPGALGNSPFAHGA